MPAPRFKPRMTRHHIGVVPKEERTLDGVTFDSKREMQRWAELKLQERCGLVRNLQRQVKFALVVNGRKIGRGYWLADFTYESFVDGAWRAVVEDVHPIDTREAALRRQLVEALHNLTVKVTQ